MTTKGTLWLKSNPADRVAVTIDVQPGRLKVSSASSVIGNWTDSEAAIGIDGDAILIAAEGEQILLSVADRYALMDEFHGRATATQQATGLQGRVTAASAKEKQERRWLIALGAAVAVVIFGVGATMFLGGGGDSPPVLNTNQAAGQTTTIRVTTTTSMQPSTTNATPSTPGVPLRLPEANDIEGMTLDEYVAVLLPTMEPAVIGGCENTVIILGSQAVALEELTMTWLEVLVADEEAGTVNHRRLKDATSLLGGKLFALTEFAGQLVQFGGKQATYASLISDVAGDVGFALFGWSVTIDPEAKTYDLSRLENLGFTDALGVLQSAALGAKNGGHVNRYCG